MGRGTQAVGSYCVAVLTGFQTRVLTRRSSRRADGAYSRYADSPRKQRKFAQEHDGTRRDGPR